MVCLVRAKMWRGLVSVREPAERMHLAIKDRLAPVPKRLSSEEYLGVDRVPSFQAHLDPSALN